LVGIGSALLLAPRFSAIGIAWSAVIAQLYTLLAFSFVLARAGLNPFAMGPSGPAILVLAAAGGTAKPVRSARERATVRYGERRRIS
jgi:hypothetical protein